MTGQNAWLFVSLGCRSWPVTWDSNTTMSSLSHLWGFDFLAHLIITISPHPQLAIHLPRLSVVISLVCGRAAFTLANLVKLPL
jgi:hypothetical protein